MLVNWNRRSLIMLVMLLGSVVLTSGCVNLAASLIHVVRGNERPAEYSGLEGKRVAILCATDEGLAENATTSILTTHLQNALRSNVKRCEVISSSKIEQWMAANEWTDNDYERIGRGVKAEQLVVVEVKNLKLRNGQTLYRGVCDIQVSVFDIVEGTEVYSKFIPEFAFPSETGTPSADISETKFRSFYLHRLAEKVSGIFYAMDATADYALDATASRL